MRVEEIIQLIEYLPNVIRYVYPGYITIYTYYFFRAKSLKEGKATLFKSCIISYIYISMCSFIPISNVFIANIGYILLSLLVAYGAYLIVESEWILKFYKFIGVYTTYYDNQIEALAGTQKGAWLKVYLRDGNIAAEGSLGDKELEVGKERYITLEAYTKYFVRIDQGITEIAVENYRGNYEEKITIRYDDIKYIERRDTT